MSGPYDDIIHLPHHQSATRPRMSPADRAAQFSSFAALTGYDGAVRETARLTDRRIELDRDAIQGLDETLQLLRDWPGSPPVAAVTCFVPDPRKEGGAYVLMTGRCKTLRELERTLELEDGTVIPFGDIVALELFPDE